MKRIKVLLIGAMVLLIFATVCSASSSWAWSNYDTISINWNDGWHRCPNIVSTKATTNSYFDVQASSKTMSSAPSVRLVNSDSQVRSNSVNVKNTGTIYTGSNNTGVPNHYLYGQIKPAWNQVSRDSIRFRVRAR